MKTKETRLVRLLAIFLQQFSSINPRSTEPSCTSNNKKKIKQNIKKYIYVGEYIIHKYISIVYSS